MSILCIKSLPRTESLKPFTNSYNQKKKRFPSHKKDWKKFESNNKSFTLNVSFVENYKKGIKQAYISKHNFNRQNKVILLTITDGER